MKRTYNKPELKSVKLMIAESLLTGSQQEVIVDESVEIGSGNVLSNQEGAHDIWGNDGSSIW
ncbi:hypothetical protein QUW02_12815 [Bacteroides eggerthii]|uniref:Uncharacterized protein n=1 Tax=Bacteroides eggerthii TaxID=28111 RepID=A0ABT7U8C5_9BACE|nr:hypothetical protein [Bacteroides eggerthii]